MSNAQCRPTALMIVVDASVFADSFTATLSQFFTGQAYKLQLMNGLNIINIGPKQYLSLHCFNAV